MMLSTVGIIFVVCIAAMLLARLFVRPIRRLNAKTSVISWKTGSICHRAKETASKSSAG